MDGGKPSAKTIAKPTKGAFHQRSTFALSAHARMVRDRALGRSALEEVFFILISAKLTMTRAGSLFCARLLTPAQKVSARHGGNRAICLTNRRN
jgi:hypothetical protein